MLWCVSHDGFVLQGQMTKSRETKLVDGRAVLPGQRAIVQLEPNGDQTGVHRVFVVENQRRAVSTGVQRKMKRPAAKTSRTEAFGDC